jgi:putative hemolysin
MNTTLQNKHQYIDVQKSIKNSKSKLLKSLPDFAIQWIKHVVKQDEINQLLNKYSDCIGRDFLVCMMKEFNIKLEVEGLENLPEHGRCIFAANHPFGIADGLILTHIVSGKYGHLKAIANEVFMLIPHLHPFIAAVDVFNGSSKAYLKAVDEVYYSDVPITHFPSGRVSRIFDGKVQDLPWQKSFITKAIASEREIVPIYFYGQNSRLFYSIFRIRKMLGIEQNLELMLLPREMLKKKNTTIRVKIGKPVSYKTFDKTKSHSEWAQVVRSQLYSLENLQ